MPTNLFQLFRERLENGMHGSRAVFRRQAAGLLSVVCIITTTAVHPPLPFAVTENSTTCHRMDFSSNVAPQLCAIPPVDPKLAARAKTLFVAAAPLFPLSDTFKLHSRPTATKTIYLDFDGHVTQGTQWNSGGDSITTSAYSFEGGSDFSDNELTQIQEVWQRVAECYSPFDVNVTTEAPVGQDLIKSGGGDTRWGIRVLIGVSTPDPAPGAGGVAYLGSFNWSDGTPTFVFGHRLANYGKYIADASVHEVGHTLGLSHDGRFSPSEGYYYGHGSGDTGWAPHMGVGYNRNLVQWSKGEYLSANEQQDDLAIIVHPTSNGWSGSNGFGYRVDDATNTRTAAAPIAGSTIAGVFNVDQKGVIEQRTDEDWFKFDATNGPLSLSATGGPENTMLDIQLALFDSAGGLIESSNPADLLTASINRTLTAGTYFLKIEGVPKGDPLATGYNDYGSLGQYRITGTLNGSGGGGGGGGGDRGNVLVTYRVVRATKTLTLTGDTMGNKVTVSLASGKITVSGVDGTKLNGLETLPSITHTGKLILNSTLGEGDDAITVMGVDASTVSLNLGGGTDSAILTLCNVQKLVVNGGPGIDSLVTTSSTIKKKTVTQVP